MDASGNEMDAARGPAPASSLALELTRLKPGPTVLTGDLGSIHPPDLLGFLHQGRRTGILFAKSGEQERAVVLSEGAVDWAASTSAGERFGEIVCRMGMLSRDAVAQALATQARAQGPRKLGELLEELGLLDAAARTQALKHQAIEIILGLLTLRRGRFIFRAGFDADALPSRLRLDVQGLLFDALRRLDEMEHYRARVPSLEMVLRPLAGRDAQSAAGSLRADGRPAFTPEMARLLALLDGARPLSLLAELGCLGEFEATKAAFRLLEADLVSA